MSVEKPPEPPSVVGSPPENIVARQSPEVRRIIESDAVLQGNISRIDNLTEFLDELEQASISLTIPRTTGTIRWPGHNFSAIISGGFDTMPSLMMGEISLH